MIQLLKIWKAIRGYKRQAGAVIALAPVIASVFGLEIQKQYLDAAIYAGTLIWGIGWADVGARQVVSKVKGDAGK